MDAEAHECLYDTADGGYRNKKSLNKYLSANERCSYGGLNQKF